METCHPSLFREIPVYLDRYLPKSKLWVHLSQGYYLACSAARWLKNVNTLPRVMQTKIVVPRLMAALSGKIAIASSGLKRKVGAPNNPHKYHAAIR